MTRIVNLREPTEKLNKVRDPMAAVRWRAKLQKQECMCCGADGFDVSNRLQVHHLAGAAGRSDEPCNFLLVCRKCHEAIHAHELELDELLAAKQLCDPTNYNGLRVLALKGRAALETSDDSAVASELPLTAAELRAIGERVATPSPLEMPSIMRVDRAKLYMAMERLKRLLISKCPGGGYIVTAVHFLEPPIGGEKCVDSNGRVRWWFEDADTAWLAVRTEALGK